MSHSISLFNREVISIGWQSLKHEWNNRKFSSSLLNLSAHVQEGYSAHVQEGYSAHVQEGYSAHVQEGYSAHVQEGYSAHVQEGYSTQFVC